MLTPQFVEEMKQALLSKQTELQEELTGQHSHEELGTDMDSSAQEVEADEVSQDVIAVLKKDLEKIAVALEKIENGTYGTDVDGNEISEARLRVIPWADKAI